MALSLSACSVMRTPYARTDSLGAQVANIPDARAWADSQSVIDASRDATGDLGAMSGPLSLLALSGGGADGAFGAGFLNGWTKAGGRPEFGIVTGVSVGALIAPFAFLGAEYDAQLSQMFTKGDTDGLLQFAGLSGLLGSGAFRNEPLRKLVARYVDRKLLDAIAVEYRRGRLLLVTTTNVDSQRTAIWNMGAIAASTDKKALGLFRKVLLASASIPGIFAPELIEVSNGDQVFREMHVDGGVTANLLIVPEALLISRSSIFVHSKPEIFVIMNGKLAPDFKVVDTSLVSIVERSFETTIKANTRNALIATRDFVSRRGWSLKIAAIEPDYPTESATSFEEKYLKDLFGYGFEQGLEKQKWNGALTTDPDGNQF